MTAGQLSATRTLVGLQDIADASDRIRPAAVRTRLLRLPGTTEPVWVKAECDQPTKSFKLRGAKNAISQIARTRPGASVIAQSSGNHALGVAYAAQGTGLDVTIVLPESAPAHKVAAVRALGVTVRIVPPALRESATLALRDELDAFLIRSDDFDVIAGAGTVGLEITEQLSDVDVVLLPVCSGSLLSGTAVAVKAVAPHAKVIGVEPELAADAAESFRAGRRIAWTTEQTYRTVADGLRVPVVGELAWEHIHRFVDDIVTVTEDDILAAVGVLRSRLGVRAEPSGAVTTAARLFHADALPRGTTVAVVSGGNVPDEEDA